MYPGLVTALVSILTAMTIVDPSGFRVAWLFTPYFSTHSVERM